MSGMDRLTDEAFEAAQFLYKHGDLTYSAARAAVAKLTDNGFTILRASQTATAPSDGLREALADTLDLLKSFGLNDSVAYRNGIEALTPAPAQEGGE